MRLAISLFILDLITKLLAVIYTPYNSFFKLAFNKGLLFNIPAPDSFRIYFLGAMIIPSLWLFAKVIDNPKDREIPLAFMASGILGNFWGRLTPWGVVDFINCHFFICNLADIFQWIGYFMLVKILLKQENQKNLIVD